MRSTTRNLPKLISNGRKAFANLLANTSVPPVRGNPALPLRYQMKAALCRYRESSISERQIVTITWNRSEGLVQEMELAQDRWKYESIMLGSLL